MDYISVKDMAEKWNISVRQVQKLCREGRIAGAIRSGHTWMIPGDAQKPHRLPYVGERPEQMNNIQGEPHYYSDRLLKKLGRLRQKTAAAVEAPSGYGKTTAVREYLESSLPQDTPVFWFTAADEEPLSAYRRLCREIEEIDAGAGSRLMEIGLPSAATIGEICGILLEIRCQSETWLIIDNFQLLLDLLPFSFISSLLTHGEERLHVVLITQILRRDLLAFLHRHGIVYITQSDLSFSSEDIRKYYRLAGVEISDKEAAFVEHNTGGWIAAVYLHLRALLEHGRFLDTSGILSLMEHLVWNELNEAQQMSMLRISPFKTVTAQQAAFLCKCDALTEDMRQALKIPFVRFDSTEYRYELHELLSQLLCKKRRERGADFDRECVIRAGDLCRDEGQSLRAMEFYIQAGDFGRILSLDISSFYTETVGRTPFYKLALRIACYCPQDVMKEHLLSALQVSYTVLAAGKEDEFSLLLDKLLPLLTGETEETSWLLADWTLLSSYRCFPDTERMTVVLKQAAELFRGRRSRVIFPDSPWCYIVVAPFFIFHASLDGAEQEAAKLEEYFSLYAGMTGGHGAGADILFRVERAYYSCSFQEAEILAYKAAFAAQSRKQEIIRLTATFYLAWLAAQKNDSAGWRSAFAALTGISEDIFRRNFLLPSSVDTIRSVLLSELGMGDSETPLWLKEGDFPEERLQSFEFLSIILHLGVLMNQKDFLRLVGTAEALYPKGIQLRRFGDVFPALITAAGYAGLGRREEAAGLIRRAAAFLLPGGLYVQLVVYDLLTDGLVEECIGQDFPEYLKAFCEKRASMQEALRSVYPEFSDGEPAEALTVREREVAVLAAAGFSNEEIAGRLCLTVNTVRAHLRSVFRKLDIDRRMKLTEKLR